MTKPYPRPLEIMLYYIYNKSSKLLVYTPAYMTLSTDYWKNINVETGVAVSFISDFVRETASVALITYAYWTLVLFLFTKVFISIPVCVNKCIDIRKIDHISQGWVNCFLVTMFYIVICLKFQWWIVYNKRYKPLVICAAGPKHRWRMG